LVIGYEALGVFDGEPLERELWIPPMHPTSSTLLKCSAEQRNFEQAVGVLTPRFVGRVLDSDAGSRARKVADEDPMADLPLSYPQLPHLIPPFLLQLACLLGES
jgi:hypothetical protein